MFTISSRRDGRRTLSSSDPAASATVDETMAIGPYVLREAARDSWLGEARRSFQCAESGMAIAAWARIDNRVDLAQALGLGRAVTREDDPEIILRTYQRHGVDCPTHLRGDFAFVIADEPARRIFAGRDPIGIRPLYWWAGDSSTGNAVVGASIPLVIAAAGRDFEVDPDWVAHFASGTSMHHSATPLRGIRKLPPACRLVIDRNGARVKRYHEFDPSSDHDARDADTLAAYRAALFDAVAARMPPNGRIGIEISGGLDSATIVGCAAQLTGKDRHRIHGLGFATLENEPAAILSVSQRAGLFHNHLATDMAPPDPRWEWSVLGHPAEHGSAKSHHALYATAREGNIGALMSGFGGDEGVTNYAPNYHREMLARGAYRDLWRTGDTNLLRRGAGLASALLQRNAPSGYAIALNATARRRVQALALRNDVVDRLDIAQRIHAESLFDSPTSTVNEFVIQQLNAPFVSTRTESCSLLAASYGVEYSWPLLDRTLIDLFLAAPTRLKVLQGMGRGLHRAAVVGIVPDDRRLARRKYLGEPVVSIHATGRMERDDYDAGAEPLHPMLHEMIDPKRLKAIAASANLSRNGSYAIAERALQRIEALDHWLKLANPGCVPERLG